MRLPVTEPIIVVGTVLLVAGLSPILPRVLALGELACGAAALLLLQGLIRDLVQIRLRARNGSACVPPVQPPAPGHTHPPRCLCMESSIGAIGLAIGCIVLALGAGGVVTMTWWAWPLLTILVLSAGWYIKDFVIDWKARRVIRVSDHSQVRW